MKKPQLPSYEQLLLMVDKQKQGCCDEPSSVLLNAFMATKFLQVIIELQQIKHYLVTIRHFV